MNVGALIVAAFQQARSKHPELNRLWTDISLRVGSSLPDSVLLMSIQRVGELDLVLRCLEDEFVSVGRNDTALDLFRDHHQAMLSELWIGSAYAVFELLIDRNIGPDDDEFRSIAHDLRLVRVPLEKHQIVKDARFRKEALEMQRVPPNNDQTDAYRYSGADPKRAHIMLSGVSSRGSLMWQVIDVDDSSRWIERRVLSDRIVGLWTKS
jgi:hypothetical protein